MSKKPSRIKTEAASHTVPQSREEATDAITQIGTAQRERVRIETAMNDELAGIKTRYEHEAKTFADQISALSKGVHLWCEANRAELTKEGKTKTANLASGEVKWRMRPRSVSISAVETVIDLLKKLKLDRFLRVKTEVNKDAMLLEPEVVEKIPGVKFKQVEDFVIVPFESELEEVL